jgi:hypothetical protein
LSAALARAAAAAGDRRTAAGALAALGGRGLSGLPRSSGWLVMLNGVIEAAHVLGDAQVAEHAYQLLLPHAELPMAAGLAVACFGSAHHALGVAAQTFGDLDQAIDHFREAVQHNLALSHWPAVAASRTRYAQALTLRGGATDHETARAQLALAEAEAEEATGAGPGDNDADRAARCLRRGQLWQITWADRQVLLEPSVGVTHLAVLLNNPGTQIASLDLVAGFDALSRQHVAPTSQQPMLDRSAAHSYRERMAQLAAQIEDWTASGHHDKVAIAQVEYDWVRRELSAATGMGGTSRSFPDGAERARTAVSKAIRRVLTRIEQFDGDLAQHLRRTVRTGITCSYRPT